jgi:hypothetical protein
MAKTKAPRRITFKGQHYVRADWGSGAYTKAVNVGKGEIQFDIDPEHPGDDEIRIVLHDVKGVAGLGFKDADKLVRGLVGRKIKLAFQPGSSYGTLLIHLR